MLTPPSHRWGLERTAPGEWTPYLAHWGQHLETAAPGEIPNRNPKATFMYSVNKSKAELALFLRSYSIYLFIVRVFICVWGYVWAKAHVPRLEDGSAQSILSAPCTWILGTELRSSGFVVSVVTCQEVPVGMLLIKQEASLRVVMIIFLRVGKVLVSKKSYIFGLWCLFLLWGSLAM